MAKAEPDSPEYTTPELVTPAWRMKMLNLAWEPGLMLAVEGIVSFMKLRIGLGSTTGNILFTADKQEMRTEWPWYLNGCGVRLTIDDKKYTVHFIRPNGAQSLSGYDWSKFAIDRKNFISVARSKEHKPISDFDWSAAAGLDIIPTEIRVLMLPLAAYGVYSEIKEARKNTKMWRKYLEV